MWKWQIGILAGAAVAVAAIYAGANEPPAAPYDAAYCAGRLSDLRAFKAGYEPANAPLTEHSTAEYVQNCADHDKQFAEAARPYL